MSLMPLDPTNPLYRILNPGMGGAGAAGIGGLFNRGPSWLPQGGGFGAPGGAPGGGYTGDPTTQPQGFRGLLRDPNFALALLANSGGPQKKSFGEVLGQAGLQTQQMGRDHEDAEFMRQYRQAQMDALNKKQAGPASVQEYEYAKQNGFTGSFKDWTTISGQTSRPSSVQEWEFYNALPDDKKPLYLEMKRNPNFTVKDVNQVPTSIQQSIVGGVSAMPLSTLPATAAAAETVKSAEARGSAIGGGSGQIVADITKKGSNAQTVTGMLDIAEPLIDVSTGSGLGAATDKVAAFFGKSLDGAQAIASLKTLEGQLIAQMPRMEGPQSDADRLLYQQAAGAIADATVPRETRKAAIKTIRQLQEKYKQRAADVNGGGATAPRQKSAADRAKELGL
jgi:hypothetical protein